MRKVINDKKTEMKLSTFEENFLASLNAQDETDDDETEDEESDESSSTDESIEEVTKCATILYDPKNRTVGDVKSDAKYYNQYGSKLDIAHVKKTIASDMFYSCAYCTKPYKTADQAIMHSVRVHPEFPLLVIDLAAFCRATHNVDANFLAILDEKLKKLDGNGGSTNNKLVLKLDDEDEQCENLVSNMIQAFKERLSKLSLLF